MTQHNKRPRLICDTIPPSPLLDIDDAQATAILHRLSITDGHITGEAIMGLVGSHRELAISAKNKGLPIRIDRSDFPTDLPPELNYGEVSLLGLYNYAIDPPLLRYRLYGKKPTLDVARIDTMQIIRDLGGLMATALIGLYRMQYGLNKAGLHIITTQTLEPNAKFFDSGNISAQPTE